MTKVKKTCHKIHHSTNVYAINTFQVGAFQGSCMNVEMNSALKRNMKIAESNYNIMLLSVKHFLCGYYYVLLSLDSALPLLAIHVGAAKKINHAETRCTRSMVDTVKKLKECSQY